MNNLIDTIKQELERKYSKSSNKKAFEDKFLKLVLEHSDEKQEEDEVDILQEFFDSNFIEDIYVNNFNNGIVIYLDCNESIKDKYTPRLTLQRYKNYYKLTSGYLIGSKKNSIFTHVNEIKTFSKKYFKSFKKMYVKVRFFEKNNSN